MDSGRVDPVSAPSLKRLLAHAPFVRYFTGNLASEFSLQITSVAVGWQVYEKTNSAFALGIVGLLEFVASATFIFVGGHTADRYDRRRIVQICELTKGATAALLAWGSFTGTLTVFEIFVAVVVLGIASAFEGPAENALLAGVAPVGLLQRATALASGGGEVATISGPALGGLAYAVSPGLPYSIMAAFWLLGAVLIGTVALDRPVSDDEPPSLGTLFDGVGFVRRNPAILGTISLDLVAVLLGGATALLPIYARDILHIGPWGLGVLRAAPAVGALAMAGMLAHRTIERRAGLRMFQAVVLFGLATIVFALSNMIWLSLLALAVMGVADTVSKVIRGSLLQSATPDGMRGRVGAVKSLFVDASNQLGEFESGVTAALIGAMPAAVVGGVGTVVVALLWMKLFPALRDLDRIE